MATTFKTFGEPMQFPLPINGDWVRVQCGVDGKPNYIFGAEGLKAFYEAGAGIYSRDKNGKPTESIDYWAIWYKKERQERIESMRLIGEIKTLLNNNPKLLNLDEPVC